MEQITIPTNTLHPNPWNPNIMNERQYEAALESIQTYGFIDPITARPHPERPNEYQVIDGEHRWKAAQELGLTELPITLVRITDAQAKKLTIILNETRGQADTINLAALLEEPNQELDTDELLKGLPYTQAELDELIELGAFNWDDYADSQTNSDATDDTPDDFHTVTARIPADAMSVLKQARAIIEQQTTLNPNEQLAWGQTIELLAAEFLAQTR